MTNVFDTQPTDDSPDTDRLRTNGANTDTSTRAPTSPSDLTNETTTPDIEYYKCGWCGYSHTKERTVRTHITHEERGKHENKNAFLDDVFVQAYDADGDLIGDMESPQTTAVRGEITPEYFPGEVSSDTTTAEILTTALKNPSMDAEAIAEEVYEAAISGNVAYVEDVLDRLLSADAADGVDTPPRYDETDPTSEQQHARKALTASPSSKQVQMPSDQKSYSDLKTKQKVVINEYVRNPEQQMTDIEDTAGISTGYGQRIIEKYDHIVAERRQQYENGNLELPDPEDLLDDTNDEQTKSYAELSPLQQRVIDHWVQNPEQTKSSLEDKADASPGYSARLFRKYEDIRDSRRDAYENGVLDDEHLNTPEFDEFIEDTSLPRDEWERIPEDEQPTGTPLEEVKNNETASEADNTNAPQSEVNSTQHTVDRLSGLSSRLTQIESAFVGDANALSDENLSDENAESIPTQVADIESRMKILEHHLPSDRLDEEPVAEETEVEQDSGSMLVQQSAEADHDPDQNANMSAITLENSEWATVIRALAHHTDTDENEVLKEIIQQV